MHHNDETHHQPACLRPTSPSTRRPLNYDHQLPAGRPSLSHCSVPSRSRNSNSQSRINTEPTSVHHAQRQHPNSPSPDHRDPRSVTYTPTTTSSTSRRQLTCSQACLSFLLQPRVQLRERNPSAEAVLVCRSYGGLLLATNLLCVQFLFRRDGSFDGASVILARSLAFYHLFPIARAWTRSRQHQVHDQEQGQQRDALGGPFVHLTVHVILLASLLWAAI